MSLAQSRQPEPAPDRRNAIGALRLALAASVIYTHAFYLGGFGREWLEVWSRGALTAGGFAVQCFFVLSGWLVTTSWRRQPALGAYLWHRFVRIAPGMWLALAVTGFVLAPLVWLADRSSAFLALDPSPGSYVWRNLFLPRTQIGMGDLLGNVPHPTDWNGSLWTLFYEGAAYLLVAGLGLAGVLTRRREVGSVLVAGLLLLHIAWCCAPDSGLCAWSARLFDTPGKLLTLHFLAGSVWAMWTNETTRLLRQPALAAAAALALLASGHYSASIWLSPFLLPVALLWCARHGPLVDLERRIGGDYSYGIYLYGYPVQQTLAHFQVHHAGFVVFLVASYAGALLLAVASWRLVEKPALGLKHLWWARMPAPVPA